MAVDSMLKASTPEPIGKPGGPGLWHHKGLMLPPYIQHVAKDLIESGHPESQAIGMAVGIIKNWAHGHNGKGGKVHPDTVAAAQLALKEWEALKATHNKSKHLSNGDAVSIDLADANTTVGGVTDSRSASLNTLLTKHLRSAHGMKKAPKGVAADRMSKLHKMMHARGGAGHSHKGGAMSYSNTGQQSFDFATLTAKQRKKTRQFGLPSERKYPMPDKSHAANAKARAAQMLKAGRISQAQHDRIVRMANKLLGRSSSKSKNMSNGSRRVVSLASSTSYDLDTSKADPAKLAALRVAVKAAKGPSAALVARAKALGCVFDDDGDDWDDLVEWATGKSDSDDDKNMSNAVFANSGNALGRVLGINLARSSGRKMMPYRPKGAERQRAVEHLRAARALHRSGRTKQAASIHSALLASATNRARVMPDGSRRAHTGQEAKIGLLILKRQSMVKGSGFADGKVTQPKDRAAAAQAKAKGPQVPTERGGRPQQAKGTTPRPQVAGKPGRLAAVPQGAGGTAPSPQVPSSNRSRYGGPR